MTGDVRPSLLLIVFASAFITMLNGAVSDQPFAMDGFVTMKVEVVASSASKPDATKLSNLMISGNINSSYPLKVSWLTLGGGAVDVYTESGYAVVGVDGHCKVNKHPGNNSEVILWDSLRAILAANNYTVNQTDLLDRGLDLVSYSLPLNLKIPSEYGGSGSVETYSVEYYVLNTWTVNHDEVDEFPVKLLLKSAKGEQILFTFFDFSKDTLNMSSFEFPESCTKLNDKAGNHSAGEDDGNNQLDGKFMPRLPPEFSAYIQVIAPEEKRTWTVSEQFSESKKFSRSTVVTSVPNSGGQVAVYDWYTLGKYQISYFREQRKVGSTLKSPLSKDLRDYLFKDFDVCRKAHLGINVTARTSSALMLNSVDAVPVYIGTQKVRGINCKVWAATVSGIRVRWYWTEKQVNAFENTTEGGHHLLLRMIVEGIGTSPYFAHHPFVAQENLLPSQYHKRACAWLNPVDPTCRGGHRRFKYIYDVFSFVDFLDREAELPDSCMSFRAPSVSLPSGLNDTLSSTRVLVFLFLFSITSATMGGFVTWCFMSSRIRRLKVDFINAGRNIVARQS
ncbi:hypothetical protein, conserved [Trypanosoma brucei brucei TREU927]|uniref:LolA-like domain-containing protein n=1 Tax=Trypanosoma brucei brucei (strain 927/4 GUTat10.1) TaxID=185431 RepID=Q38DP0_TRYB2|nr:hypothetical protein, conserved [Trypanosoma brucei brucei TREU927]EAN77080.1 hypothetical protein, conserved [Trypanosoma brucei brucei TREU927]